MTRGWSVLRLYSGARFGVEPEVRNVFAKRVSDLFRHDLERLGGVFVDVVLAGGLSAMKARMARAASSLIGRSKAS
jgi:hypothetical protein